MTLRGVADSPALRAFRHRNYRLFFIGQGISLVGSWMQSVAQAWLVYSLTNDPFILGVVAAVQWTPVLILGLFGGLIADALPKKATLLALEGALAALALVLGLVTAAGIVEVWMIMVLAVLFGCVNAVEMPARQAFAVEMVGREDVVNAIALNAAQFNGARVLGPAIAGITIAAFSTAAAFLINAASFAAVILGLLAMRDAELNAPPPIERPRSVGAVFASIGQGLRYVRAVPTVLLPVVLVGVAATVGFNFQVTIPPFARDAIAGGAQDFGFLMTATGIGSVTAALLLATRHRPSPWWMASGALLLGLGQVVTALLPSYAVALLLLGLAGFGGVTMAATGNTLIQSSVPDELRGRVMSVYITIFAGSTPVGALLIGWVSGAFGPIIALGVSGVGALVVGCAGHAWLARNRAPLQRSPTPAAIGVGR